MLIRAETAADIAGIAQLTTLAFATAPHSSGTEAGIIAALRAAGALTLSLVATQADVIWGHVAFSPVLIDGVHAGWFGLGPVAVRPKRQRTGIGSALIRAGLTALQEQGAAGCVVLGDPIYYGRFGFTDDPDLRLGELASAHFQRLVFKGAPPRGSVAYHEGFYAR